MPKQKITKTHKNITKIVLNIIEKALQENIDAIKKGLDRLKIEKLVNEKKNNKSWQSNLYKKITLSKKRKLEHSKLNQELKTWFLFEIQKKINIMAKNQIYTRLVSKIPSKLIQAKYQNFDKSYIVKKLKNIILIT